MNTETKLKPLGNFSVQGGHNMIQLPHIAQNMSVGSGTILASLMNLQENKISVIEMGLGNSYFSL